MFEFPEDDDQRIGDPLRPRLGRHSMLDIAGPGAQRTPAELPGIEVPKPSAQPGHERSQERNPERNVPRATMAAPAEPDAHVTSVTSAPSGASKPSIAGPALDPIEQDRQGHQAELSRMQKTGSGISQIHNPFLRGLAHVADIAGSALFPFQAAMIPGTELHHRQLMGHETSAINQDLSEQHTQAQTQHEQEQSKKIEDEINTTEDGTPEEQTFAAELKRNGGDAMAAFKAVKEAGQKPAGAKEGELPLAERVPQMNKILEARFQVLNPGQPLRPEYTLPPTATQKDYDRIDKALEAEERARGTKAQQDQVNEMRRDARAGSVHDKQAAGSEKSYQSQSKRLDNLGKPISDAVTRLGRLQETLRQGTPQADALVAPELLTVMAGGAGSGLRMNEAEIARVIGGRSKAESLKAALNQWSTNPEKANSITPAQRQQMQALVNAVHERLLKKQAILSKADEDLLESDDPADHKRIVVQAKRALSDIDEGKEPGGAGGGGGGHVIEISGKHYRYNGQGDTSDIKNYTEVTK